MSKRFAGIAAAVSVCVLVGAIAVSAQRAGTAAKANDSFFAALEGKNEVDPPGDKNGRGSFAGTFDGGEFCFGYSVKNIGDPIAAHIHAAPKGRNGDVVVTLDTPESGDPGSVAGCVEVPKGIRSDILDKPKRFYVNVHTEEFPGGAVRGQLFARKP